MIEAIASGDAARVTAAIQFTKVKCVAIRGNIGSPPQCPEGVPDRTPIDAFSMELGCDGTWIQPASLSDGVTAILERARAAPTVFAVLYARNDTRPPDETNTPPAHYTVVYGRFGESEGSWFVDVDTGIVREMMGCGYAPEGLVEFRIDATQPNSGYLLRRPAR